MNIIIQELFITNKYFLYLAFTLFMVEITARFGFFIRLLFIKDAPTDFFDRITFPVLYFLIQNIFIFYRYITNKINIAEFKYWIWLFFILLITVCYYYLIKYMQKQRDHKEQKNITEKESLFALFDRIHIRN